MSDLLRVRFCPAPSGWLHVGGARTALFNWLWARRNGGTVVLRIEDTDADRATLASARGMMDAMAWLGLDADEYPSLDDPSGASDVGPHGPYLQSARRPLHEAVARRLLAAGHAYEAYETPEELEALRTTLREVHPSGAYKRRLVDLDGTGAAAAQAEGRQPVLRIQTPDDGEVGFDDLVRGPVSFDWAEVGDFVIARADGSPTYPLANVVDDVSQGITLVARGEDLLSATPRQILMTRLLVDTGILDEALEEVGYPARPEGAPDRMAYAHMPLLIGDDRKKLSKRHGDVAIDAFAQQGYLPEVMVNFLALCGWSLDGETERFTVPELIDAFSFDRVKPSPALFDVDKLRSMNGDAIKALAPDDLGARLIPAFQRAGLIADPPTDDEAARVAGFAPLLAERAQTLDDAPPFVAFAFTDEITWDDKAIAKWLKPAAGAVLDQVTPALEQLDEWSAGPIMGVFEDAKDTLDVGMGKVMQPVRVLLTGTAVSPPLPETLELLDKDWVIRRLRAGRDKVATPE